MANNPNNIRLGPCRVRWGGKDMGLTKGGVDVEVKTTTKQVTVDQFGNTPVNEYITGRELMIKCPFAESDIDTIYALLRNAGTEIVDNGTAATGTITFSGNVSAGDVIIVNGHTFTFRVSAPVNDEILIGGTLIVSIANAVAVLEMSSDPLVNAGNYTAGATTLGVAFYRSGTEGNAFTLAEVGTVISVSGATLTGGTLATIRRVEVYSGIGQSMYQTSEELVLHPIDLDDNDTSEDFVIAHAATPGAFTFAYKLDTERVLNLTFTGYPDPTTKRLFLIGNKG